MEPNARIGRYEVIRPLGQGGMGRVVLARDSVLGRQVAVKVLRDDLGLPPETRDALFSRMRNEARAAAGLSHPNMVTLHDMGDDAELGLFLVFEYVDGPTLRDRIFDGPLPLEDIARIARQLGDALTHAHAEGVIHRDVKPENVLLDRTGAKLADFGIARLPDSTLTQAGAILGTPAYSAPEALALAEFSPASDQFSLAATLYESISARRAFPGDDALSVASRIAAEKVDPLGPSLRTDPRVMARLDRVLARGLAKDPKARYASCRELGEAVAQAIEMQPVAPTPVIQTPLPFDRSGSVTVMARRNRAQNIVAGLGVMVILALVLFGRRTAQERLAPDPPGDGASLKAASGAFAAAVTTSRPHPPKPANARPHLPHPRETKDAGRDGALAAPGDEQPQDGGAALSPGIDDESRDASDTPM